MNQQISVILPEVINLAKEEEEIHAKEEDVTMVKEKIMDN